MKKIIINVDGGSRGNPGLSAIGIVFCNEKKQVLKKYAGFIGEGTNNNAEYIAAITALKKMKIYFGKKLAKEIKAELRSDSELLVKQMKGEYKILNPEIQKLFLELWNLKIDFPNLQIRKIPRSSNVQADKLVNQALDEKEKPQIT